MKKTLSILFSILSLSIMAQVPQGVGYQGVATDANGIELVNQAISIRASILSGSVNGTVQWQEVHDTTTDDFGLFALTIGEGNNTGGGMLSSFAEIPWGESTYFLRIEMDATGGMDYSLMGVNQMMSVPYALYAENSGNPGNPGPQGEAGEQGEAGTQGELGPQGEQGIQGDVGPQGEQGDIGLQGIQGNTGAQGENGPQGDTGPQGEQGDQGDVGPQGLPGEDAVLNYDTLAQYLSIDSSFVNTVTSNIGGGGCDYDFPEGLDGEVVLVDLLNGDYTVPAGKNFYIISTFRDHPETTILNVNGSSIFAFENGGELTAVTGKIPYVASPGDIISYTTTGTPNELNASGLLVDKNIDFLIIDLISGNYTVPSGKKLYITSSYKVGNQGPVVTVNGSKVFGSHGASATHRVVSAPIPYIVKSGDIISCIDNGVSELTISGYLVDEDYFADCGGGGSSGNSNSNTSGPNQTVGIGSITDLNDFDKEYDMFNAQFSGEFGNEEIHIHTDQLKNIYIIGSYSSNDNNSIGGISLYSGSGGTFFIAKYDSTGVIISVISEPVSTSGIPAYYIKSSIVDNYGNIFVGGRIQNPPGEYYAFIRKYSTTNLTFVEEEISSSSSTSGDWNNVVYDIVSDGSGGVYLVGCYEDDMTIGGVYLAADNTNHQQGFVFHWNSSGNVPWANSIGDINESNLDDFASSIIIDQNNDILVTGSLKLNIGGGSQMSKHFIKRYDAGGTLMTTVESTEFGSTWYESWGVKINTDNNGNIYLFTACDNLESNNYAFNSYPLDIILGTSQFLYKMDTNFSVLNAINFGTVERRANQIITLSNNDVILRSMDLSKYIIDNNVYLQDVNQYGNITHLDSNNSFIKFHTIGNNIGTQDAISITSDANTIYCLYKRVGTFINNGTNHPTGYYVVKEQY